MPLPANHAAGQTITASDINAIESAVNTNTTAIAGKAATAHAHVEADVTSLVADLAGKAATAHTHAESDVTNLVADLSAANAFRGALAYVTAATTALASGVLTSVALGSEAFDTNALHDNVTNNDRVVLNKIGYWKLTAQASFAGSANAGYRQLYLMVNGGSVDEAFANPPAGSGAQTVSASAVVYASVITDYASMSVRQNSGISVDLQGGGRWVTYLTAHYLGT